MYQNQDGVSKFFESFGEGLIAPVVELIFTIMMGVLATISSQVSIVTGVQNSFQGWFLFLIPLSGFIMNVLIGFAAPSSAWGHLIGNICGLALFFGVVYGISPESAVTSVLMTVVLIISLGISMYISFKRKNY